jgi:RNA polymerase sigma-70 factor (ECF subfamily)
MSPRPDPKAEMLAAIPRLRAFALSLSGNPDRADDLVQQTLVNAWANMRSFQPGSNMPAWLYTILRNEFYSEFRKRRREVADPDGVMAARLSCCPTQEGHLEFQDFRKALFRLAPDHRESLLLVGASGISYEQAAKICHCAIGTMKSRVHRARGKLAALLTVPSGEKFGPDVMWQAAVNVAMIPRGGGASSEA